MRFICCVREYIWLESSNYLIGFLGVLINFFNKFAGHVARTMSTTQGSAVADGSQVVKDNVRDATRCHQVTRGGQEDVSDDDLVYRKDAHVALFITGFLSKKMSGEAPAEFDDAEEAEDPTMTPVPLSPSVSDKTVADFGDAASAADAADVRKPTT